MTGTEQQETKGGGMKEPRIFENAIKTARVLLDECYRIHKDNGYSDFDYQVIISMVRDVLQTYRLKVVWNPSTMEYTIEPMTAVEAAEPYTIHVPTYDAQKVAANGR